MVDPVKDQFEYIVKRFQEIVNRFDKFKESISSSEQFHIEHSNKLQDLKKKYDHDSELLARFSKICTDNASISHERHENAFSAIVALAIEKDKHKKEINECKSSAISAHEFIKNILNDLKNYAKNCDLQEINNSLVDISKDVNKNLYSLDLKHNDLKIKYNSLLKQIDDHKLFHDGFAKSLSDLDSKIESISNDHDDFKRKIGSIFQARENLAKEYIDEKISAIPQPKIPSLEDAKKSMKDQIEPISFDAKNAHLRSENNEKKIQILEKKVEQLQLLLNKFQLGN